jgi:hypothetical protein
MRAITRRTLGVGGRGVEMAQTSGRQDHRRGVHDAEPVVAQHEHTGHGAIGVEQLERDVIAPDVQPGRGVVERPLHLGTRGIAAGVDDPASRMPALAGERPLSRRRLVELRSVVDQSGDRAAPSATMGRTASGSQSPAPAAAYRRRVDRILGVAARRRCRPVRRRSPYRRPCSAPPLFGRCGAPPAPRRDPQRRCR